MSRSALSISQRLWRCVPLILYPRHQAHHPLDAHHCALVASVVLSDPFALLVEEMDLFTAWELEGRGSKRQPEAGSNRLESLKLLVW
jgi:hypothetical protein